MTNQPHTLLTEFAPNQGVQLTVYSLRLATLCSGFRQQLTPGVDMTSDVKGWEQLFYVRIMFFPFIYRKSRSQ